MATIRTPEIQSISNFFYLLERRSTYEIYTKGNLLFIDTNKREPSQTPIIWNSDEESCFVKEMNSSEATWRVVVADHGGNLAEINSDSLDHSEVQDFFDRLLKFFEQKFEFEQKLVSEKTKQAIQAKAIFKKIYDICCE